MQRFASPKLRIRPRTTTAAFIRPRPAGRSARRLPSPTSTNASADVLENAFGINGSQSAGSLQFLENGAWNKRIHTGLTAHNAILALRFAQAGAVGARDALEGRSGFFRGYTDGADVEHVVRTLGERFAVDETAFKPYPSCRYSHAAIDLIREIIAEAKLKPEDVSAVRIGLPRKGMDLIGVPEAAKRTPRSIVDGQFSMFFLAAVALLAPAHDVG